MLTKLKNMDLSRAELMRILDAAPVAMIVSCVDGSFEYVNSALCTLLGYEQDDIYLPETVISDDNELGTNQQIRQRLLEQPDKVVKLEKRYRHKNGQSILLFLNICALLNSEGEVEYFLSQIIDIRYRKKIEQSVNLFRSLINASSDAMFIIDPDSARILDVNAEACNSLGYTFDELVQLKIIDVERVFQKTLSWDKRVAELNKRSNMRVFGEHIHKDGHVFPVEKSVSYIVQDGLSYVLAIVRDITERKKSEELIWRQANYDMLTGLPNRNMLYDRLRQASKLSQRYGKKLAVLSLDLDRFKEVNDTLGHDMGDLLLQQVSQRLLDCVRDLDTVARLGGDEFCILIERLDTIGDIDRIAKKIICRLAEPFHLNGQEESVSASIGISLAPDDTADIDGLLKKSDQAMYFAKNKGRNCYQYFTENMHEKALQRVNLSRDLHGALPGEQFLLEYQPIVALSNGSVHKAEALLRWQHPNKGLINTADFIMIAEENGMIKHISEWVFNNIVKSLHHWRSCYCADFQVSINASPVQFREGYTDFSDWSQRLSAVGLGGGSLLIEITEGLIMDTDKTVTDKLLTLRDAGIQVALDDFGTGYSSLSYLQKLDIDYLKIDRSFVEGLSPGSDALTLCEAVIAMAHRLKLKVVAEGIENEEQRQLLKAAGCDYGQGFLFSKALPVAEFEEYLEKENIS